MDKIINGWQCPICRVVYSPLVASCTCASASGNDDCIIPDMSWPFGKADWEIWSGWSGNHNQRIDDAKCSKCGYIHKTVFNTTDNLSRYCPSCKSEMGVKCSG